MALGALYEKWEKLMVWGCPECGNKRGYLEPGTTGAIRAFLECKTCHKNTEHVRTGNVREFKVVLQR